MNPSESLLARLRQQQAARPDPDVTISLHGSQWPNIPEPALRLLSLYVGPIYPDKRGVYTFVVSETRWAEIQRAMLPGAKVEL